MLMARISGESLELLLLNRTDSDFSRSATQCFAKPGLVNTSWIAHYIRRALIFSTWTASLTARECESCFYRNKGWCTNFSVKKKNKKHAALTQKHFCTKCKPLYLQQESSSFILAGVYFPPQA